MSDPTLDTVAEIHLYPPREFHLTAIKAEDGTWKVVYSEVFEAEQSQMIQRTLMVGQAVAAANPKSGIVVSQPRPTIIALDIPAASLEQLGNLMVGEFLLWSGIGRRPLADLILGVQADEILAPESVKTALAEASKL